MPVVSVILPIYKVEAYLKDCLDSLLRQTYRDIEIIAVNDCSPDNSLVLLKSYAQKDNRIKIIDFKQNRGVSMARNVGIETATAPYLYFMDSDDWMADDYIEQMVAAAQESLSDIVVNTAIRHVKGDTQTSHVLPFKGHTHKKFWNAKESMTEIFPVPWNKLFTKSFIQSHHLSFPERLDHEDFYFQYVCFAHADKIYTFDGPAYYYRHRTGSFMDTLTNDDLKMIKVYQYIYNYRMQNQMMDIPMKLFYMMPCFCITDQMRFAIYKDYFEKIKPYFEKTQDLYNDVEKFFVQTMCSVSSFEEYRTKFSPSIAISYLRKKNKRITIK